MAAMMKLSDYVVQFLADRGVQHVFLLTGGGADATSTILSAAAREFGYICNLHEQACAIAAEAYAKYDNRLAVAMVTVGPGATNTITGVAGACWIPHRSCFFRSG